MEKVFVAQRVAKKLWGAEASIDKALTDATALMADVLQAPVDMKVSPTVVDPAQAKIMEACKLLSEARTAMIAAHSDLYEAKLRVGIRTKMFGIGDLPESIHDDAPVAKTTPLREVG